MKKGFTLIELLVVIAIIGILSAIGLNSFISARTRSRDARRKSDLEAISKALEMYYNDQGQYPGDDSGNIVGCGAAAAETCIWNSSAFANTDTGEVYMTKLPGDTNANLSYYYESFTISGLNTSYQLYARLENTHDVDVPKDTDKNPQVYDGVFCGNLECNYGVSSNNTTIIAGRTLRTE